MVDLRWDRAGKCPHAVSVFDKSGDSAGWVGPVCVDCGEPLVEFWGDKMLREMRETWPCQREGCGDAIAMTRSGVRHGNGRLAMCSAWASSGVHRLG